MQQLCSLLLMTDYILYKFMKLYLKQYQKFYREVGYFAVSDIIFS